MAFNTKPNTGGAVPRELDGAAVRAAGAPGRVAAQRRAERDAVAQAAKVDRRNSAEVSARRAQDQASTALRCGTC